MFKIHQKYVANFQINATNVLNYTQFAPNTYNGGVGSVQVGNSPSTNDLLGYRDNASYGTHTTATLDPRLIEFQARLHF